MKIHSKKYAPKKIPLAHNYYYNHYSDNNHFQFTYLSKIALKMLIYIYIYNKNGIKNFKEEKK